VAVKGTLRLASYGVADATAQAATGQGLGVHGEGPSNRSSEYFTGKLFTRKFAMFPHDQTLLSAGWGRQRQFTVSGAVTGQPQRWQANRRRPAASECQVPKPSRQPPPLRSNVGCRQLPTIRPRI